MTSDRTRARPFAKAIFELAKETKQLDAWQATLTFLAVCVETPATRTYLLRLRGASAILDFLRRFGPEYLPQASEALVAILVRNHAWLVAPAIRDMYHELLADQRGEAVLKLKLAIQAPADQAADLITTLERRFNKKLTPQIQIDPSIQGGFWAKVGDQVVDASVRGAMEKLTRAVTN